MRTVAPFLIAVVELGIVVLSYRYVRWVLRQLRDTFGQRPARELASEAAPKAGGLDGPSAGGTA